MELFKVYNQFDIEPIFAKGSVIYDKNGKCYLDFYGGHAVISIGHQHPHFQRRLMTQMKKIAFYSNAVFNSLQNKLADLIEELSGVENSELFLCNSGAEANENALKLASFYNNRTKILALESAFHGRTSAAVRATHNLKIQAPINQGIEVVHIPMNDSHALEKELRTKKYAALIIEAIQGVGGCYSCTDEFLKNARAISLKTGTVLILDEVQCGYGRSGDFFAFQSSGIKPDIITIAKGMGNGFPVAGVLIDKEKIKAKSGLLGTTFGGNHLACAAGIAVLEVIKKENLIQGAKEKGDYLRKKIKTLFHDKIQILGKGLMIGLKFAEPCNRLRKKLIYNHGVFTGGSSDPTVLRILPPLTISKLEIDEFIHKMRLALSDNHSKISI